MILSRILLIPVIAAIGYEILRFGARHRKNPLVKVLLYPGLLVQMITTKRPTDDMIEVAIVSMERALVADGESVPEGSGEFEQRPMQYDVPADAAAAVAVGATGTVPASPVPTPTTTPAPAASTDPPPGA